MYHTGAAGLVAGGHLNKDVGANEYQLGLKTRRNEKFL